MTHARRGKPGGAGLIYNGEAVHEGSPLYNAFNTLSKLPEHELAKASSVIEILFGDGGTVGAIAAIQTRLERLEQGHAPEPLPAEAVVAETKKPSRKRGAKKPDKELAKAVAEELAVPLETVKERQARMARMEKDEKMKARAIARQAEQAAKAAPPPQVEAKPDAEAAAKPPKKRPRRRRRRGKGGASIPGDAAMPA